MAEWSIAAVLKTVELRGSGGSNPSLSAAKDATKRWVSHRFFRSAARLGNTSPTARSHSDRNADLSHLPKERFSVRHPSQGRPRQRRERRAKRSQSRRHPKKQNVAYTLCSPFLARTPAAAEGKTSEAKSIPKIRIPTKYPQPIRSISVSCRSDRAKAAPHAADNRSRQVRRNRFFMRSFIRPRKRSPLPEPAGLSGPPAKRITDESAAAYLSSRTQRIDQLYPRS